MAFALVLGLLTTVANIAGSLLAIAHGNPSRKWMAIGVGFSGGFILAAALIEMMPHAIELGHQMPALIGAGFLLIYITEHIGNVHMHSLPSSSNGEEEGSSAHLSASSGLEHNTSKSVAPRRGLITYVAFNVHDFLDGLAIGAALVTDQTVGVMVFLAVLIHEFPAGFAVASILRGSGWSRLAALTAGISIGIVTLVGIAIPFLLGGVSDSFTGVFLSLATGTFIYLGASILIPVAETGRYRWAFVYVALGFVVFYLTSELIGSLIGS